MNKKTKIISVFVLIALAVFFWPKQSLAEEPIGIELINNSIYHIWNNYENYYIEKDTGIEITNDYNNYYSNNDIGFRFIHNGTTYLKWKEDFNFTWITKENQDSVSLIGYKDIDTFYGEYRYGVNYTLKTEDQRITAQWGINNNGEETLENTWLIWKIKDIQINNDIENDFYRDYENPQHFLNLSENLNETYNNLQVNHIQIEDVQAYNGIKLWWDENLNDKVNVYSDGTNREVNIAVKLGNINPDDKIRQNFYWVDPPVCSGQCGTFTWNYSCKNSTGDSNCKAKVGDYVNITYSVSGTCFGEPNDYCYVVWQDNTPGSYDIIPMDSDDEEYCQESPNVSSCRMKLNDWEGSSKIYCSSEGNYSNRGRDDLKGSNSGAFNVECVPSNYVTNETEARDAILEGVNNVLSNYNNYEDQQIYTVTINDTHTKGLFDIVTKINKQTWAFNYLINNETFTNVNSLLNIVNILELENLDYSNIVNNVENSILDNYILTGIGLEFDGYDDYAIISDNNSLDLTNGITIEGWLNSNDLGGDSLVVKQNSYHLRVYPDKVNVGLKNETESTAIYIDNTQVQNVWTHYAFTWNNNTNLVKVYVNGELIGNSSFTGNINTNSEHLYIGKTSWEVPGNTSYTNGTIDEVRIWNIALDQENIRKNRFKELNGDETGLVAYWKMNENTSYIIYDNTSNSNHGSAFGPNWVDY